MPSTRRRSARILKSWCASIVLGSKLAFPFATTDRVCRWSTDNGSSNRSSRPRASEGRALAWCWCITRSGGWAVQLRSGRRALARYSACVCARRDALLGERFQESFAVVLELGRSHAGNAQHLRLGFRARAGHLEQSCVGEHHVRRHAALARDLLAQRAQAIEERQVGVEHGRRHRIDPLALARGGSCVLRPCETLRVPVRACARLALRLHWHPRSGRRL